MGMGLSPHGPVDEAHKLSGDEELHSLIGIKWIRVNADCVEFPTLVHTLLASREWHAIKTIVNGHEEQIWLTISTSKHRMQKCWGASGVPSCVIDAKRHDSENY